MCKPTDDELHGPRTVSPLVLPRQGDSRSRRDISMQAKHVLKLLPCQVKISTLRIVGYSNEDMHLAVKDAFVKTVLPCFARCRSRWRLSMNLSGVACIPPEVSRDCYRLPDMSCAVILQITMDMDHTKACSSLSCYEKPGIHYQRPGSCFCLVHVHVE